MIHGSCLCGAFQFELERIVGPFELCHCSRCRKLSGGMGMPAIGVHADDYRVIRDDGTHTSFAAPLLNAPPAYHSYFCAQCGAPLPPPDPAGWFEIPAGLLDDDIEARLDRRIYVEYRQAWESAIGDVPKLTRDEIAAFRTRARR